MRKRYVIGVLAAASIAGIATAVAVGAFNGNVGTHLKGRYEVPLRSTDAQGQAIFRISDDGQSVDYKLIASNIDNAFMAHIHLGPATGTGPIVVWLYPGTAPVPGPLGSGRHDGVLAEGTFTAANLVGPLAGHPLSDLIDAIQSGNAYAIMGIPSMNGKTDESDETVSTTDFKNILAFANAHHLSRLTFWAVNRDRACSSGASAGDSCSGVSQSAYAFTKIFAPYAP